MKKITLLLVCGLVSIFAFGQDELEQVRTAYQTATRLKKEQKYAQAVPYLQQVITYFEKKQDLANTSQVLAELADAFWNSKDYENARLSNEKRLSLCIALKDTASQKFVLADLGQLAIIHEKNNDKARKFLNASLALCKPEADNQLLVYDYDKLANLSKSEKQFPQYRDYLAKLIELYNTTGQKDKAALAYWETGIAFDSEKNYAQSATSYERALPYYLTSVKDTLDAAILLSNLGITYKNLKKYDKALAYFQQSLEKNRLLKNKKRQATSFQSLAEVYELKKDIPAALASYQKSRQLLTEINDKDGAVSVLSKIAKVYQNDRQYDKASPLFQEVLKLRTALGNKVNIGEAWWEIGYNYDIQKEFDKATEGYKTAVNYYLQAGSKENAATLYDNLAINFLNKKDFKLAADYYQKALLLRKETGNKLLVAGSLKSLGSLYWTAHDFAQSKNYYNAALNTYREVQDKSGTIYSLANVAKLYRFYEIDFNKSETLFKEALVLAQQENDENILAYCYSELAELYDTKGDFLQYKELKDKALALYQKRDDLVNVGNLQISLGIFYAGRGELDKAADYLRQALALGEKIPDPPLVASAYTRLAWIDAYQSNFAEARDKLQKSLAIYQKTGDDLGRADVYFNMGQNLITEGDYQKAEQYLSKTDSIYVLNRMEAARGDLNNARGRLYYRQQDFEKSYLYHKADYDTRLKYGDKGDNFRVAAVNVGECLMLLKKYPEATSFLQTSLEYARKNRDKRGEAVTLEVLGELETNEKKYAVAEKHLADALHLHREMKAIERIAGTLRLQARLFLETKRYPETIRAAEEGVTLSQKIGLDFYMWESLKVLGEVSKIENQKPKSITYFKEAVETLERMRDQVTGGETAQKLFSSGEDKVKVYETLIDLLLQQGEVEEAMEYLHRHNEGELQDRFKNIKIDYQNEEKDKFRDEERSQKMKIEGLEKQLTAEKSKPEAQQNTAKIQNLEAVKTVAANEYVNFARKNLSNSDADRFVDLRLQRTKIPQDMAVLSYLPGEKQLYIFVATRDSAVARVIPITNEELKKRIDYVRNRIRSHDSPIKNELSTQNQEQNRRFAARAVGQTDEFLKTLELLYQSLIAPVQDVIQSKTKLAIMPSGELHFLPFQVLGKTLADGNFNFLVEDFTIFYTKDFKMLTGREKTDAATMKIIAFANPDRSLPATEKEVTDIKKMYPNTQAYYREDATEDKAKDANGSYNVIHFATHGNLDYARPEKSFLTMAKNVSKGEDGMLSLQDLWGMDLMSNLNLVVLSACNTAMSSSAEVPVSPATGFFDNGVKSVIASLWKVNDDATAVLMADFYSNLKTMEVSEALRQAQISLTHNPKFHHPYYWSPFILMGDWK